MNPSNGLRNEKTEAKDIFQNLFINYPLSFSNY